MELAVLLLSVAVVALATSTTVLAAAVPFLGWRLFRLEGDARALRKEVDKLDEALAALLAALSPGAGRGRAA